MEGEYNEAESHAAFMDALNAWRNAGKENATKEPVEKAEKVCNSTLMLLQKVRFTEESSTVTAEPPKAKGFLYNVVPDENFNLNCLPQFEEKEIATAATKPAGAKESCWNCYKLYVKSEGIQDPNTGKGFCTRECHQRHIEANSIKCMFEDCSNRFLKAVGVFVHAKWFCSEECSDKDPETKQIKELYENGIEFDNYKTKNNLGMEEEEEEEEVEIDL